MNGIITWAGRALLILAAVFCAVGAVISAYDLPVGMPGLFSVWLVTALALSAIATRWRIPGILAALPVGLFALYLKLADIAAGGKWVAYVVTDEYSRWLSVPVLFRGAEATDGEIMVFCAAVGIALAFLIAIAVCLRYGTIYAIIFTLPFMAVSIMIVDYAPNPRFLAGLAAVWLTMHVSGALRPDDIAKRGAAVFPALALTSLVMGAAYIVSSADYLDRDSRITAIEYWIKDTVRDSSLDTVQLSSGWPEGGADYWRFNTEYVPVADAGRRTLSNMSLLEVTSDTAGTFYLRGYSMESFDGRSWVDNSDGTDYSLPYIPRIISQHMRLYPEEGSLSTMTVGQTGDLSRISYVPYYPYTGSVSGSDDATFTNPNETTFFHAREGILEVGRMTVAFGDSGGIWDYSGDISDYLERVYSSCTQVDSSTAAGLRELAGEAGIDASAGRAEIADQVAGYISSAARYTLTPAVIPADEDFALYFLQTSRQGYCVHFATAATLMLRALDVPARFTSGFVVTVSEGNVGEAVTVTDRQAHAWVEVYYDNIGWVPLEVTPSTASSGIPAATAHTASAETEEAYEPEAAGGDDGPQQSGSPEISAGPDASGQQQAGAPDADTDDAAVQPDGEGPDVGAIITALLILLGGIALAAVLILRRDFARQRRKRDFEQTDTNAAVIRAWIYITRLHGRGGTPPEEVEELALKARFSQHVLSEEERAAVVDYARRLAGDADQRCNALQRFWLRYGRALY